MLYMPSTYYIFARRGGGMRSLLEPNRPDYCNPLICLGIYVSIQLAIIICNKREHYMPTHLYSYLTNAYR